MNDRLVGNPWPDLTSIEDVEECVALFIDLRGSTEMAAHPLSGGATNFAKNMKEFLQCVRSLCDEKNAPQPVMAKSLGDGLMLVWQHLKAKRGRKRIAIFEFAMKLSRELSGSLRRKGLEARIGMGLAGGAAARVSISGGLDYFGYVPSFAAKLQTLARPDGLVVDGSYFPNEKSRSKMVKSWKLEERGLPRRLREGREADKGGPKCWVTHEDNAPPEWTCLAWPGLERTNGRGNSELLGLSDHGITVITHQGLHGKIDQLEVWNRTGKEEQGDKLEFIVDDYDTLEAWNTLGEIRLSRRMSDVSNNLKGVFPKAKFLGLGKFPFIPIRCGLNAVVSSEGLSRWECPPTYAGILSDMLKRRKRDAEPNIILYDNPGASMPIILASVLGKSNGEKLLERACGAGEVDIKKALEALEEAEKANGPLFELRKSIEGLQAVLEDTSREVVVLGGGSWLLSAGARERQGARVWVPAEDGGLLWVEGAGVLRDVPSCELYVKFLKRSVLSEAYQDGLRHIEPYPCLPVLSTSIGKLLSDKTRSAHAAEARRVFETNDRLKKEIVLRTVPKDKKDCAFWLGTWEEIRTKFCKIEV